MTTTLLIIPSEKIYKTVVELFKKDIKNTPCIYVGLNKPYKAIERDLKKRGVNTSKIFFIDCITASISQAEKAYNVLYTSSPEDLTGLAIAIDRFFDTISGKKYLIIESLRTLLIYNSEGLVTRFVMRLIAKAEQSSVGVSVLMTKGKNLELIKAITPSFDEVKKKD